MLKQVIEIIIKFKGFFDIDQVVAAAGQDRREVKWRLDRLEREGYVSRVRKRGLTPQGGSEPGRPTQNIMYTARKGLKNRLAEMAAKQRPDTGWDKMWRTIRVMRRFTRADLVQLTGASDQNVKDFTKLLIREGYLKAAGPLNKRPVTWVLCKDPGPQRPRISKKAKENELD